MEQNVTYQQGIEINLRPRWRGVKGFYRDARGRLEEEESTLFVKKTGIATGCLHSVYLFSREDIEAEIRI